jgi:hypothetical protein
MGVSRRGATPCEIGRLAIVVEEIVERVRTAVGAGQPTQATRTVGHYGDGS